MVLRPPFFKDRRFAPKGIRRPFFKDRFLGGLGPKVVGGPVLLHVADANDRLSLTAEGVVVTGAGTAEVNGTYTQRGTFNDKPYYNLANSVSNHTVSSIYFDGPNWLVQDSGGNALYHSDGIYEYPWLVATWINENSPTGDPVPTVTHSPGQVTGAGYQVTQDDESNLIVHTFNGDGADADAGLWVTGAGDAGVNGAYIYDDPGHSTYTMVGESATCALTGSWAFSTGYVSVDTPTYAWQVSAWDAGPGTPPYPTVSRNPIASNANWTP